jgi:hypothetical protein
MAQNKCGMSNVVVNEQRHAGWNSNERIRPISTSTPAQKDATFPYLDAKHENFARRMLNGLE